MNQNNRYLSDMKLRLTAYAANHMVELALENEKSRLELISVSYSHARLSANAAHDRFRIKGLKASLDLGLGAGAHPCEVSWIEPNEIEVAFTRPLPVSIFEIQRNLSKAA